MNGVEQQHTEKFRCRLSFLKNLSTKSILCVYEWETFLDLKLTYTSKTDV